MASFSERKDKVTPKEVLAMCREKDVKAVDLRFMDFPGLWQHFTIPVNKLDEDIDKAAKPDCRNAYQDMELLAAIPLIAGAITDRPCSW